jgi:ferredoxin-NADP reductase
VAELDDVVRRHGYHPLRVTGVVAETADARSFVLDVPVDLRQAFEYRPGQFCSFRVRIGGDEFARCYSMSSAPETDGDLIVTVKRVPGGVVSNWLCDHVAVGDVLEVTRPAGTFCVRPGVRPVIGFCGGSGVTPVMSIVKSVLATSDRPVAVLYANRQAGSVIFDDALAFLQSSHPGQFVLRHHVDAERGYLDPADIVAFVGGRTDADFYVCGPAAFMELVEGTLLGAGVEAEAINIERFTPPAPTDAAGAGIDGAGAPERLVLILRGKKHDIAYRAGDTVLETARRANLPAPYSCEAGNCATCMALLQEGGVTMRTNNALTPEEVEEGWILTCQSLPTEAPVTIEYEPL